MSYSDQELEDLAALDRDDTWDDVLRVLQMGAVLFAAVGIGGCALYVML